jgi:hypothetical protein
MITGKNHSLNLCGIMVLSGISYPEVKREFGETPELFPQL